MRRDAKIDPTAATIDDRGRRNYLSACTARDGHRFSRRFACRKYIFDDKNTIVRPQTESAPEAE
jgi:hypothetical protein